MSLMNQAIKISKKGLAALAVVGAFALAHAQTQKKTMPGVPQKKQQETAKPKATSQENQGNLPEVEIRGGERTGVESEKNLLELQLDPDEVVLPALEVEQDLLNRQPESLQNPRAGFAKSL